MSDTMENTIASLELKVKKLEKQERLLKKLIMNKPVLKDNNVKLKLSRRLLSRAKNELNKALESLVTNNVIRWT